MRQSVVSSLQVMAGCGRGAENYQLAPPPPARNIMGSDIIGIWCNTVRLPSILPYIFTSVDASQHKDGVQALSLPKLNVRIQAVAHHDST